MKDTYTPDEPIVAIATALAPAALGIIRVSGSKSIELLAAVFSRPKALNEAAGNTLVYGWIVDSAFENQKLDEVMLGVYRAPKSFTGEEMVEIFCHGGTSGVLAIYQLLLKSGFRAAEKGEFTFRSFINGKTGLTQAEAVHEIIAAKTTESTHRAANRLNGGLQDEIVAIKNKIIASLAALEVETEYPEDEETINGAFDVKELIDSAQELEKLSSTWSAEKLYQDGAKAVLCGKTNAGKSRMFNALLKEERAIVSDIHGTTRDWLESWSSFGGIPVRLYDTAGLRDAEDLVERQGVKRTKILVKEADIILYVMDSTAPLTEDDRDFLCKKYDSPLILILNKADALTEPLSFKIIEECKQKGDIHFDSLVSASAKTGQGIADIIQHAKTILLAQAGGEKVQAGLGSARQKQAVEDALTNLHHALSAEEKGFSADAVIHDLEETLACLSEITGEITSDDVLESIFSQFCVGK